MASIEDVTVVIVTHNSEAVVSAALDSVPTTVPILCIDNGSRDGTPEIVSRHPLRLIRTTNLGYGRACNLGAQTVDTDYILFMNPDARLRPEAIVRLLAAAEEYPDADIFCPRVESSDGLLQFRDVSRIERWQTKSEPFATDPVGDCCKGFFDGCVFFVRRAFFLEAGGFDPNIFLYFEDDDLSYRLRIQKHQIIHVNEARAIHDPSTSCPATYRNTIQRSYYKKLSEYYVKRKYQKNTRLGLDAMGVCLKAIWCGLTLDKDGLVGRFGAMKALFAMKVFPGTFDRAVPKQLFGSPKGP